MYLFTSHNLQYDNLAVYGSKNCPLFVLVIRIDLETSVPYYLNEAIASFFVVRLVNHLIRKVLLLISRGYIPHGHIFVSRSNVIDG